MILNVDYHIFNVLKNTYRVEIEVCFISRHLLLYERLFICSITCKYKIQIRNGQSVITVRAIRVRCDAQGFKIIHEKEI